MDLKKISIYLSYVLRHNPGELDVDECGWVNLEALIDKIREKHPSFNFQLLEKIVSEDDKNRYSIDNAKIRANQGHSININPVKYNESKPPPYLYHGTSFENCQKIYAAGSIEKMSRHHVHLSQDLQTAINVAKRRKSMKYVVLEINTMKMYESGFKFFLSQNGVWLVSSVPVKFIEKKTDIDSFQK